MRFGAAWGFGLWLSACSGGTAAAPAEPPSTVATPSAASGATERALAYAPGDGPTDRRIARAQQAVREAPHSVEALDTLGLLFVRRHRETGDGELLRDAQELVDAALVEDDADPIALSLSGMLAMQSHRFADARSIAERILRRDRQDTTALLLLGDADLELGDDEASVDAYQRASDLRPDLRTYNRGAYVRWLHGDPQGALELLELAIDSGSVNDPEASAWCWVDLATVHWHLGNRLQVGVAIERALALVPDYLPALRLRARLRVSEGRRDEAIADLERVLARQELVGELLYLAEVLEAEGRSDEASARVARAIQVRREDPRTLAVYRARHGLDADDALRVTEAELTRRHDVYTHAARAMALARVGRADEARAAADAALALGTPDVALILDRALVLHLAGQDDAAREALGRARALNPFVDPWLFDQLAHDLGEPLAVPAPSMTAASAP